VHQLSTFIYTPNFIEIGKNFLWTDARTDIVRTYGRIYTDGHFRPPLMLLGRLGGVTKTRIGGFSSGRKVEAGITA